MRRCLECAATFDGDGWQCPRCGFAPPIVDGLPLLAPEIAAGNPEDATYDYARVRAVEAEHFWFTGRSRLIAWAIERYFPAVRSMFDVGCGTGGVIAALNRDCRRFDSLPRTRWSRA